MIAYADKQQLATKAADIINDSSNGTVEAYATPNGSLVVEDNGGIGFIDTNHPQEMKIMVQLVVSAFQEGVGRTVDKIQEE